MNGISSVTDSPRTGQAHQVVTPEVISAVEAIVKANRRVTVNGIATRLDMSPGSAQSIVLEVIMYLLCSINYSTRKSGYNMYRGWTQTDYQNKHYNINQKDEGT